MLGRTLMVVDQVGYAELSTSTTQDTKEAAMQAFSEPMWSSPVAQQPAAPEGESPGQAPQHKWHDLLATREGNVAANEQLNLSQGSQDTAQVSLTI